MTATLSQELREIADANEFQGHTREVMDRAAAVLGQIERADGGCPTAAFLQHHKGGDNLEWEQPAGKFSELIFARYYYFTGM